uniref:hypothetical protein n=1 Tax=Alistipes megaguti TaxID=2364787 RepID=UPI0013CF3DC5|nr:hypothetical protein [Alistipes megaguti]
MKKYLYLSVALLTTLSLGACGDDDGPGSGSDANVQFSTSSYTLDDEPIDVKVVASQAAASDLNIGFTVGGTATAADYELSAQSFLLEAGKTEATVTVTPKQAFEAAKTLTLTLTPGTGYTIGRVASTTVNLAKSSVYVYSFTTAEAELQESLDITLTVGDDNFKAPKDLELPFEVLSGSTAELGKHFLVKDDATSFIVPKDGNTATLTLLPGPDVDLNNPATLKLGVDEQGGRFIAGEIPSVTVTIKGLLSYAALAGTWECKELIGLEMLELWAMDEEMDTETIPSHNDGFTISITNEGDHAAFTPSSTGDLTNLFRDCKMTYTAPFNVVDGVVSGNYTTVGEGYFWVDDESFNLTYFQLDRANRAFDKTQESLGKMVVALALDENGSMLLFLRDLDTLEQPPFLPLWWDDPFEAILLGLGYRFDRISQ